MKCAPINFICEWFDQEEREGEREKNSRPRRTTLHVHGRESENKESKDQSIISLPTTSILTNASQRANLSWSAIPCQQWSCGVFINWGIRFARLLHLWFLPVRPKDKSMNSGIHHWKAVIKQISGFSSSSSVRLYSINRSSVILFGGFASFLCHCHCLFSLSLRCCCRTVIIKEVDVLLANSCFHLD